MSVKLIIVPILNNEFKQVTRSFCLILTNPSGGGMLGSPTITTVSILDNETGHHRYAATTRAPDYDVAHHFTGEKKVKDAFVVSQSSDELTGSFLQDLSLADGTILPFHPAGIYQGVRMPIEPINWDRASQLLHPQRPRPNGGVLRLAIAVGGNMG